MALVSPRFRNQRRVQSASDNAPPFRRGEVSDGVRAMQEALVDLGYASLKLISDCEAHGVYFVMRLKESWKPRSSTWRAVK